MLTLGSSFAAALAVYFMIPHSVLGTAHFVAAYDAFAIVFLAALWRWGLHRDPQRTRARAASDDPGRNLILIIVLVSVVVGLISAIVILGQGPQVHNYGERIESYAFGVLAIVAGWFVVHTVYALRYAHLYWYDEDDDGNPGGVKFPDKTAQPSDYDFAYFSFVIGMTFQVSDVVITEPRVRREVLGHALISFAYNTVIVAMVINVLAGLFSAKN